MIKTHPGMSKPALKPGGVRTHRSPPVSFLGTDNSDILIPGCERETPLCADGITTVNTARIPRLWAQGRHNCHKRSRMGGSNGAHSSTIGWETDTPLCAEVPLLWGFTEGYPMSIRSLSLISPGRASNSAQSLLLTVTPSRLGGSREPLLPILISRLSPGLRRQAALYGYRDRLRRS